MSQYHFYTTIFIRLKNNFKFNKSSHDSVSSLSLVLLSGGSILSSTMGLSRDHVLWPRNSTIHCHHLQSDGNSNTIAVVEKAADGDTRVRRILDNSCESKSIFPIYYNILQKETFIAQINYYKIRHLNISFVQWNKQILLPVEYFRDVNIMDSASLLVEKLVFLRYPHEYLGNFRLLEYHRF